jgi:hypothetical protein
MRASRRGGRGAVLLRWAVAAVCGLLSNRRRQDANHRQSNRKKDPIMKTLMTAVVVAMGLLAGQAYAASAACEKSADDKKLSGAARSSHIKKCEADAGSNAACEKSADDKKLSGAARSSHIKKCVADGGADTNASAACEKSAADKNLAGAAKTSHVKKCMADASAKK